MKKRTVKTRSLLGSGSHLSQQQVDYLSVTNAQFYQDKDMLYMCGGYGVDTATGLLGTKSVLSALQVSKWVEKPESSLVAKHYIRFVSNDIFKITGGRMAKLKDTVMLVFGQTFEGNYTSNGIGYSQVYSNQIRRFKIHGADGTNGTNGKLKIHKKRTLPKDYKNPNYRRRDLNVIPRINKHGNTSLVAYSGVFTEAGGILTVPVEIDSKGKSHMADPTNPNTFMQGMNNYSCASISMYSKKRQDTYSMFYGGMSYITYSDGSFVPDPNIGSTSQCTTIKITSHNQYTQYLMENQYPTIPSTTVHIGDPLLFGSNAEFILDPHIKVIDNQIIDYDALPKGRTRIGYIAGGIVSTTSETSDPAIETSSSNYIFTVVIIK